MNCARLRLQERKKPRPRGCWGEGDGERCRRYCEKRMVDPMHEEDPRWTKEIMERFRCKPVVDEIEPNDLSDRVHAHPCNTEDLFLTVQTLKFQGDSQERKRTRTSFKYKAIRDGNHHRMFVKQILEDQDEDEAECPSQEPPYYFADYVKYILSPDRSRPSTACSNYRSEPIKEDKVESGPKFRNSKENNCHRKTKAAKKQVKIENSAPENGKKDTSSNITKMDDAKISYRKTGKRKSLTISRAQSPETVQVIRVDVVCNYSSADSNISDCDEKKPAKPQNLPSDKNNRQIDLRNTQFANKYLLTKTVKSLDANVSGGARVTLLCKTFRLTDRTKNIGEASKAQQNGKRLVVFQ